MPLIERSWFDAIYAVDGKSTDGTVEYLKQQGIPVYTQPRKSLNAAVVYAFEKCSTDALILFHPKGTIAPASLGQFRRPFEEGVDFVVASRMICHGRNEEDDRSLKPRKWFVLALALAAASLFRRERADCPGRPPRLSRDAGDCLRISLLPTGGCGD